MFTRRDFLRLTAATSLTAFMPPLLTRVSALAEEAAAVPSLKAEAAKKGLIYGTGMDTVAIQHGGPTYNALVAYHCSLYGPTLSWKWIDQGPGKYDYSEKQPGIDFALAHGMRLSSYHLLWHETFPDWYLAITDRAQAEKAIRTHIRSMAKFFAPISYTWNVVNEAIDPWNNRPDRLRESPLLQMFGPEYFKMAFDEAKEAAPNLPRLYNDYGMEATGDVHRAAVRRKALLDLLDRFDKEKVPITAVGLQSHLNVGDYPSRFNAKIYRDFLKEIAARGLPIHITELDVLDKEAPANIAERDKAVANAYQQFLEVTLDEPSVKSVVTWGLSDQYSWLNREAQGEFVREDGLSERPLPFDNNLNPKPAYYAMLKAFQGAPKR